MVSNRYIVTLSTIIFFLMLDQSIKIAVESHLIFHQSVQVFPFFSLYLTHNTGISFSLLSHISPLFIISIRILIISLILLMWKNNPKSNLIIDIGYILIISGALGNLIDHCLRGHVIDYIMLHTKTWYFAIFNLADFLISVGSCILIYNEFITSYKKKNLDNSY
ncbi:MAG: signal peptidase II [Candidatus Liberibacter ctenarytainae]|uniref:Lipoprotein signal peptidase n=1 Tax=Candidatus Liberibacter ctenarytainae TaxID=2020335 RepID=A0A937AEM1_9HYPH|nr:signal peptidase II [Candidatus Liberibacter ctenarytainae]